MMSCKFPGEAKHQRNRKKARPRQIKTEIKCKMILQVCLSLLAMLSLRTVVNCQLPNEENRQKRKAWGSRRKRARRASVEVGGMMKIFSLVFQTIRSPRVSIGGVLNSQHDEHIYKYQLVSLQVPSTCRRDQLLRSPRLLPAPFGMCFWLKVDTFGNRKGCFLSSGILKLATEWRVFVPFQKLLDNF